MADIDDICMPHHIDDVDDIYMICYIIQTEKLSVQLVNAKYLESCSDLFRLKSY